MSSFEGNGAKSKYKLMIVAPTCFYYQVDLFRQINANPRIDLTVYFCSDEALTGRDVPVLYNSSRQWAEEEDLLTGFKYQFLRNYAPWGSYLKWPFGLMNFGLYGVIRRERPDAVIIMGWTNLSWWLAIMASWFSRIPFFYMNDANMAADLLRPHWKQWVKAILLKRVMFKMAAGFLSSGQANDQLYKHYDVPDSKIIPFAYSVIHRSILLQTDGLIARRKETVKEIGFPEKTFIILFCGRLIKEKGAFQLLEAFSRLEAPNKALIFAGDGESRFELEEYTKQHNIASVKFLGFLNRDEVMKIYPAADLLVLPSWRETWGMVVNEALCFGLPVIVSDQVGAGPNLVQHGSNGYIFPTGEIDILHDHIKKVIDMSPEEIQSMRDKSLEIITEWSKRDLVGTLLRRLDEFSTADDAA